ncbi:PREDICTED: proline-rich receptor-like protein kinase PERK1 [Calidris pugnax]|uniref:proline-rich receptor-like protein kinase PERK1 n=1 Tax=Calidris pugnax TaxID=198806 RepID=UPI00071CD585|nr:PREDICTED: proline-rich receptor-like protein kinase PERK1 [Calidris pugnax]
MARGPVTPTRLFLLLLFLLLLPAQEAWAAPWRARELAGADGHPTSEPRLVQEPQGHPTGPHGAKDKAERRKSSHGSSGILKELLKELRKAAHAMDEKALREGGGWAVPDSDEEMEATQSTARSKPGEGRRAGTDDSFPESPGLEDTRNLFSVDPKDFRRLCTEGAMAILGSVLFGMILCCGFCVWKQRKERLAKASRAQHSSPSRPSRPDSRSARAGTSESRTQQQQPSPAPGEGATEKQGAAPASPDGRPAIPPPPPPPPLPTSASRPVGTTPRRK